MSTPRKDLNSSQGLKAYLFMMLNGYSQLSDTDKSLCRDKIKTRLLLHNEETLLALSELTDDQGNTALQLAHRFCDLPTVKLIDDVLCYDEIGICQLNKRQQNILHSAVLNGDVAIFEMALYTLFKINKDTELMQQIDMFNKTVLDYINDTNNIPIRMALFTHNLNNHRVPYLTATEIAAQAAERAALQTALSNHDKRAIDLCLQRGADPFAKDPQTGKTVVELLAPRNTLLLLRAALKQAINSQQLSAAEKRCSKLCKKKLYQSWVSLKNILSIAQSGPHFPLAQEVLKFLEHKHSKVFVYRLEEAIKKGNIQGVEVFLNLRSGKTYDQSAVADKIMQFLEKNPASSEQTADLLKLIFNEKYSYKWNNQIPLQEIKNRVLVKALFIKNNPIATIQLTVTLLLLGADLRALAFSASDTHKLSILATAQNLQRMRTHNISLWFLKLLELWHNAGDRSIEVILPQLKGLLTEWNINAPKEAGYVKRILSDWDSSFLTVERTPSHLDSPAALFGLTPTTKKPPREYKFPTYEDLASTLNKSTINRPNF